ncbi:MAG: type II CAAX endopeptidase family protein [Thermoleophilia bacterium]
MESPYPPPPPLPPPPGVLPPPRAGVPRSPGFWWRVLSPPGAVLLAFVVLFVVAGVGFAAFGDEHEDAIGTVAVVVGGAAILGFGLALLMRLPEHERRIALARKHSLRGALLHGLNLGIGMVITAGVIIVLGMQIDPGLEGRLDDTQQTLGPGAWGAVLTVFALVVLAPLGEELVFRVLLLRALVRRMGFWPAAVVSGLIFGSVHLDAWIDLFWPRWIALVVVGIGLAWLYRWRGYWASVAAHATVNIVASIALVAQG